MSQPTYPITGIREGWGEYKDTWHPMAKHTVPVRVEVDDWFQKEEFAIQRNLVYQAMAIFQAMPLDDMKSYFGVAGIHGLPHIPWDAPGKTAPQYCKHGTVDFAGWHRPYMLLFEQRLYEIMVNEIIPKYPSEQHDTLNAAAKQFRMPFWDWALKKSRVNKKGEEVMVYDLPLISHEANANVTVTLSDGKTNSIANPFYSFRAGRPMGEFGITPIQISANESIRFDRCKATSRMPPPGVDASGRRKEPDPKFYEQGLSGVSGATTNIREAQWYYWAQGRTPEEGKFKLAEATYRLLSSSYLDNFIQFVTSTSVEESAPKSDGKVYLSLEGIHNNVHNWIGQGWGHMSHVPVAAFDPIFWLHHCNIDRLMAIWQERNPTKWWVDAPIKRVTPDGRVVERGKVFATGKLEPFSMNNTRNFYTSNTCKNFFDLGYTYPELQPWKFQNNDAYQNGIKAEVAKKYQPPAETLVRTLANHDVVANVSFERFALGGAPFTVALSLADKPIGEVFNFSAASSPNSDAEGSDPGCENCQQQQAAGATVTGQVFMSEELAEAARESPALKDLSKENIMAFVKDNLTAKVFTPSGDEVEVPSLKVTRWIGNRDVFKVPLPGKEEEAKESTFGTASLRSAVADDSLVAHKERLEDGITTIPEINPGDLADIKAEWTDDRKTVLVYGHTVTDEPIAAVRVGKWGAYEEF